MPFNRLAPAIILSFVGFVLVAGNIWFTCARSTIPLALDGVVMRCETRHEKHLGVDDVHLIMLNSGRELQVDKPVYDSVDEGDRLYKQRGEQLLHRNEAALTLVLSPDAQNMIYVMALVAMLVALQVVGVVMRGAGGRSVVVPKPTLRPGD